MCLLCFTIILNLSGNELTSNDLGCILEKVLDVSAKWYNLGLQLKLGTGILDRIDAQFRDPRDQLREMLKTWLTTCDNTSWKDLTDALRRQSVGAIQLAGQLEKKYCPVEGTDVSKGISLLLTAELRLMSHLLRCIVHAIMKPLHGEPYEVGLSKNQLLQNVGMFTAIGPVTYNICV